MMGIAVPHCRAPRQKTDREEDPIMRICKCGWLRRLAVLVLAIALLLSLHITALAEESGYTPTDPYVLVLRDDNVVYRYAQFSKLVPYLRYNGEIESGYSIVFGLEDRVTNQSFESLYCVDLPVGDADGDVYYQRLNLSDSTYAAALADKLRGIVLNTYPSITLEKLRKTSGIADLTLSEAITGSQLAIWQTAHGNTMQIENIVGFTGGNGGSSEVQAKLDAEGKTYSEGDEEYKAAVKGRIETLYQYLLDRPEQSPSKIVASNASFIERSAPTVTADDNGTYTVSVTTTVKVTLDSGDSLMLSAYLGDGTCCASTALYNGQNKYTLTIRNVPAALANGSVTLAIDGEQYGDDVYFIDANGIRGVSQSLIGVLKGTYPVHAEVKTEPDRVLNIEKTDGEGNGLSGLYFDVYYVGSTADYLSGKLGIGTRPTEADIATYAKSTRLVGTLVTDAQGKASLNLYTTDGIYLVKELPNADVEAAVKPFFVCLPDYSRGDPVYTITAFPKNTVVSDKPTIEKDVTEIGNKSDTYAVGQVHQWIIRTSIPKGMAGGKSYVITDTLDHRLNYQHLDRVELVQFTETDQEGNVVLTLTKGEDYTLTEDKTTDKEGRSVDRFTVSLTAVGIRKVAKAAEDPTSVELRTWFTAQINQNAQMGTEIPNQAHIDYTNSVGKTFREDSDQPEVHTGGTQLKKVDASDKNKTLSGATFAVYRMATQEEVAADKEKNELPQFRIGETTYKMVQVAFYGNAALSGDKVTAVTTDSDGKAVIYGLAYGEYYLVETQAPDGYRLLPQPTKFVIDAASHLDTAVLTVTNSGGAELPTTGGMGTTIFTVLGAVLVCVSAVLLVTKRRMRA